MPWLAIGATLVGGMMQSKAAGEAADAQSAADAARLAEEQRVREQLRQDTEVQRAVADQAFQDYQNGLISQAEAQQRAGQAYAGVQQQIAGSQLSDVAKVQEMTQFQPYSIRTGTGSTFFDTKTGQAGFNLSPQLQAMQQNAYGAAQNISGNLTTGLTPEQQAYQNRMYGTANQVASNFTTGLTPEQQAYQNSMYGTANKIASNFTTGLTPEQQAYQNRMYGTANQIASNLTTGLTAEQQAYQQQAYGGALSAMGAVATTPQAAAQQYMQQQQGLLQPGRAAEDIALRQQQLQRGRIGLGISGEAAGAGAGGMVNPEQFARDRARALADAQIAAQATQAGQQQAANQLSLAQGLFGQGAAGTTQQQQQLANQINASTALFGQGAAGTAQQQQQLANQLSAAQGMFSQGAAGTAQQQQQLANQINASTALFGQGAAGTAQQQQQLANQISAGQGLYNLGYSPDQAGMNMLNAGMQYGQTFQNAGINQANLYNQGMANVYNSTLGAAGTLQNAANYVPQVYSTIGSENYQRQQTALGNLQGNQLPYQAMTTPQATVPGSAYVGANLGNTLVNYGVKSMFA